MSQIVIGFSKPAKFRIISWFIRKAEHTKFSHTYVKLYDYRINRWMVYEASGMITHCSTESTFKTKNKIVKEFTIGCASETEREVLTDASDSLNLPYGMKQLIGIGLVRLCSSVGWKIRNPFADGRATYVCSEYVGKFMKKLGYEVKDLDELTPKDIYEVLNGPTSKT